MNPAAAVAVLAAVTAAVLVVPGSPRRALRRLAPRGAPRPRLRWWWVALLGGPPLVGGLVGGARGLVAAFVAEAALVTAGWLLARWWRRRRSARTADEVAHACQVLAAQLAVGRTGREALDAAAADCPVLARGRSAIRLGGDVVATWRDQAAEPGCDGLLGLARAWQVAETTGAPLVEVLGRLSAGLARQRRLDGVLGAELAAPRATAQLMAVLPAVGVLLGIGLGGDPAGFLMGHPLGQACLVSGVLLACGGVVWVERIATGQRSGSHRARRPGPLRQERR